MSPDDARRAALVASGGVTQVKEATRDAWLGHQLGAFSRELRYGHRSLRRSPGFVTIAVITLGLGIGGATAIASVVSAVLFQQLPAVPRAGELFAVERVNANGELDELSYADYLDIRDHASTVAGLAAYDGTWFAIEDARAGLGRAWVSYVSDNFFATLGVHAVLGRMFGPADVGRYTPSPVAVIGYKLWQTRYHGDSSIVGSVHKLADQPITIIGVAPEGFVGAMRLPCDGDVDTTAHHDASDHQLASGVFGDARAGIVPHRWASRAHRDDRRCSARVGCPGVAACRDISRGQRPRDSGSSKAPA